VAGVTVRKTAVPVAFITAGVEGRTDSIEGGRPRARELGYRIEEFSLNDYPAPWRLQRTLEQRGVRGVIVGRLYGYSKLPALDWEQFAVVVKSRPPFPAPFPMARADYFAGVHRLWRTARERGYRRVGVVTLRHPSGNYLDDWERYGAALSCLETVRPAERVPPFFGETWWEEKSVWAWFKKYRPDAVIGFTARVLFVLRYAGVRIPQDVGFAAMVYNPLEPADQFITGLLDPKLREAELAVEMIDRQLRQPRRAGRPAPVDAVFEQTWVEGSTLPAR
jgi:LacI family transcriptional regulator